jgi:hypothetical protein
LPFTLLLKKLLPVQVTFPASVTAGQRAVLHELAAAHGLKHLSCGEGEERRITISNSHEDKGIELVRVHLPAIYNQLSII